GHRLKAMRDRQFGRYRVERGDLIHRARQWQLVVVPDDPGPGEVVRLGEVGPGVSAPIGADHDEADGEQTVCDASESPLSGGAASATGPNQPRLPSQPHSPDRAALLSGGWVYPCTSGGDRAGEATRLVDRVERAGTRWWALEGTTARYPGAQLEPVPPGEIP